MIKIKYDGKIYPREFISERSANIMINKLVREILRDMPATKTKKQKKTVSKEYVAGIRNKFSLIVEATKLRKSTYEKQCDVLHKELMKGELLPIGGTVKP